MSQTTVSRVLTNRPGVKEETPQKVLEIIDKFGNYPNHFTQSLRTQKTSILGLVIYHQAQDIFSRHNSLMTIMEIAT